MFYRTIGCLTLFILFLTLPGILNTAESKTQTAQKKKPARIEGFRSAKFGMKENDVLKAIKKDFKIAKDKVINIDGPRLEKTKVLKIHVPELVAGGGAADIGYIFGYKSKRLTQVNIGWGRGVTKKVDGKGVVNVANLLRTHLNKKEYKKEGFIEAKRMNNATTIVLSGRDKKNRMVLLVLNAPRPGKGKEAKNALDNITLALSYLLNPDKPDVYTIRDDDF